ncbi:peptidase T [Salmonella enterica subsp. enterica serovar Derby]|nr:peptidase T [Salmonella enterica subsp. enterica serovar Derby str. 626]
MGLVNITLSEKGTLMATLPANVEGDIPAIGFISHVDTSPDFSGKNVKPADCRELSRRRYSIRDWR